MVKVSEMQRVATQCISDADQLDKDLENALQSKYAELEKNVQTLQSYAKALPLQISKYPQLQTTLDQVNQALATCKKTQALWTSRQPAQPSILSTLMRKEVLIQYRADIYNKVSSLSFQEKVGVVGAITTVAYGCVEGDWKPLACFVGSVALGLLSQSK